jgi:hypothetical protein
MADILVVMTPSLTISTPCSRAQVMHSSMIASAIFPIRFHFSFLGYVIFVSDECFVGCFRFLIRFAGKIKKKVKKPIYIPPRAIKIFG